MTRFTIAELATRLEDIKDIARKAGKEIMHFYDNGAKVITKADGSPVTEADHASHRLITARLAKLTPDIAVISEEDEKHADITDGKPFWTVDPLDGTKGFVGRTGRFFVKIALIENYRPVLGVIYEPPTQTLYASWRGGPAIREIKDGTYTRLKTVDAPDQGELRTVFNQLHHKPEAYDAARDALAKRGLQVQNRDNAQGYCSTAFHMAVASGEADIYLDCGSSPTLQGGNGYSWDYAPDWLILKNAGGTIIEINSGQEPLFDKPATRMNSMIGLGDKELGKKVFPEYKIFAFKP